MLIDLTPVHAYVCVDNETSPVALPVSFSKLARTSHGLITFNSMRQLPGNTLDPDDQAAQAASHPSEIFWKFLRGHWICLWGVPKTPTALGLPNFFCPYFWDF